MAPVLRTIVEAGAVLSALLGLWQWVVAWRFPIHRRLSGGNALPGVTILKPIKGCDSATEACLQSWFHQEYPGPRQILLGVASLDDPVVPLVQRLLRENPEACAELVHCQEVLGVNAKVSTLRQLHTRSAHPILCVSDADVWAPADFLSQAVVRLAEAEVGLVNSFYSFQQAVGIGLRWEATAINSDFWSQVLQSASLRPLDFALGAAMVFSRDEFDRGGGFEPLSDLLADDFHLGHRLANQGLRIELSTVVVECRSRPIGLVEAWLHQLRWGRTIRTCRPIPYFFSILSNISAWALLWWLVSVLQAGSATQHANWVLTGLLSFRSVQAVALSWRLTTRLDLSGAWMAWVKDLLHLGVWACSFLGTTVTWRGVRYRVDRSGKLTRVGSS